MMLRQVHGKELFYWSSMDFSGSVQRRPQLMVAGMLVLNRQVG
jgi:hypothetical protein